MLRAGDKVLVYRNQNKNDISVVSWIKSLEDSVGNVYTIIAIQHIDGKRYVQLTNSLWYPVCVLKKV